MPARSALCQRGGGERTGRRTRPTPITAAPQDDARNDALFLEHDGIAMDFSRQRMTTKTLVRAADADRARPRRPPPTRVTRDLRHRAPPRLSGARPFPRPRAPASLSGGKNRVRRGSSWISPAPRACRRRWCVAASGRRRPSAGSGNCGRRRAPARARLVCTALVATLGLNHFDASIRSWTRTCRRRWRRDGTST